MDVNGGRGWVGGRQDSHRGGGGRGSGSGLREAQVEINWGRRGSSLHGIFSHL